MFVISIEEIERDVKTAWLGAQKAEALEKAYAEMRAKYEVLIPVPPDDATTAESGRPVNTVERDAGVSD